MFGSKVGHSRPADLLLQPADGHPLADLPGVREPGPAGRRRPCPATCRRSPTTPCCATGWAGRRWISSPPTFGGSARANSPASSTTNSRTSNCAPSSTSCASTSAPPCTRPSAPTIAITTPGAERILSTLFLEGNESQTEQLLSGLSPEFFLQVEWLPGGRFEEGEFLFDPIFDEAAAHPEDAELQRLCDPRAKGIIFNLIREYGDLDYINVGCVPESLSLDRPQQQGRRGVLPGGVSFPQRARPDQTLHAPAEMGRLGAPGRRQGPAAVHQGERRLHRLLPGPAAGLPPVGHEPHPPRSDAPPERDL